MIPYLRYSRCHYGIKLHLDFRPGIDDERNAFIDRYNGKKRCRGRAKWLIGKVIISCLQTIPFSKLKNKSDPFFRVSQWANLQPESRRSTIHIFVENN